MTRIEHGEHIGQWVAEKIGSPGMYAPSTMSAIGLMRNGRIVAGIFYENWNGASVTCHLAMDERVTPEFLNAISVYAFDQLGVKKIIAPVMSNNDKSIRMVFKMGFFQEGRIRDAQPNGHVLIFTMTREQCAYLGDRYGQERKASRVA